MTKDKEKNEKEERRQIRKKELEKLTVEQLHDIKPYRKKVARPSKRDATNPTKLSKVEMIETILAKEGLGISK